MDITQLRADVTSGRRRLRITTHAQVEAAKDGLLLADLRHVFNSGRVIEEYPVDRRWLLYGTTKAHRMPVHIVVEQDVDEVVIVTAYIPDSSRWIGYTRRRKR